ncbi:MAG: MFS transporter, partial [Actinocatenispora sp.]
TAAAPTGAVTRGTGTLRAQLALAATHRPFVRLLTCFVIQAVGIGMMLAGVQYFADHVLGRPAAGSVLFACFVGPALLVMPLWTRFGRRAGKLPGYLAASGCFALGGLALAAAPALPTVAVYLCTALVGVGYAGQQAFALAMLPDTVADAARRTGRRQAGVFTGLWTAGETLGLALGPGVFGVLLQLTGYLPSTGGEPVPQPAGARVAILVGFTAVPAVLMLLGLLPLRGYPRAPTTVED